MEEVGYTDGLNFDQFVDCLARCGMVAYSNSRRFNYDEMYPSLTDKVQAIFVTHMSLLDQRAWRLQLTAHRLTSKLETDLGSIYAGFMNGNIATIGNSNDE